MAGVDPTVSPFAGKYNIPVHPESLSYLQERAAFGAKPSSVIPVEQTRRNVVNLIKKMESLHQPYQYKGTMKNMVIPSPYSKGGLPVRVYKSSTCPAVPVILIYFHGGGHYYGDLNTYDTMCRVLTDRLDCVIVNVDYRRAPENKLPADMEDAEVASKWVMENKKAVGGAIDSPVGVAGDSAGGQIAAVTAYYVKGLAFQVLVYPCLDLTWSSPSVDEFEHGPRFTKAGLHWAASNVMVKQESDKTNPRICPLYHEKFDHLVPALIIVAQIDPIRDDGRSVYPKPLVLIVGDPYTCTEHAIVVDKELVMEGIDSFPAAILLLFELHYCFNLDYNLAYTFEFIQKYLVKLDDQKLSSKTRNLLNKIN